MRAGVVVVMAITWYWLRRSMPLIASATRVTMKRRPYAVSRSGCSGVRIRQKIAEFQKAVAGAEPLIETSAIEHTAEVLQVDETYRAGGPEDWAWAPGLLGAATSRASPRRRPWRARGHNWRCRPSEHFYKTPTPQELRQSWHQERGPTK